LQGKIPPARKQAKLRGAKRACYRRVGVMLQIEGLPRVWFGLAVQIYAPAEDAERIVHCGAFTYTLCPSAMWRIPRSAMKKCAVW